MPEQLKRGYEDIIKEGAEYLKRLQGERARPEQKGEHVKDKRVATETADHLWELGRIRLLFVEQQNRWIEAMERNRLTVGEIDKIQEGLEKELRISANQHHAFTPVIIQQ